VGYALEPRFRSGRVTGCIECLGHCDPVKEISQTRDQIATVGP